MPDKKLTFSDKPADPADYLPPPEVESHQARQYAKTKQAEAARAVRTAAVGVDLMNAYNHGKTDPGQMAVLGHDTMTGFEFCVERDGVTYIVEVHRDLGS